MKKKATMVTKGSQENSCKSCIIADFDSTWWLGTKATGNKHFFRPPQANNKSYNCIEVLFVWGLGGFYKTDMLN